MEYIYSMSTPVKQSLQKAFNDHFTEFIQDIVMYFQKMLISQPQVTL